MVKYKILNEKKDALNRKLAIFIRLLLPISGIGIFLLGILMINNWIVGFIGFCLFISTLFSERIIPAKKPSVSKSRQIPTSWKDYMRNPTGFYRDISIGIISVIMLGYIIVHFWWGLF